MIKKSIYILLIILSFLQAITAEESEHQRINSNESNTFQIQINLSVKSKFPAYPYGNVYDFLPQAGFDFILYDDYILSINQPLAIRGIALNPKISTKIKSGVKIAISDLNLGLTWLPSYKDWQFRLGINSTVPTAPWKEKNQNHFVQGSGRYAQNIFTTIHYITDPVVIGGTLNYTFITPQIDNKKSDWIPAIVSLSLETNIVLNQNFSILITTLLDWNSNELSKGKYILSQSVLSEMLKIATIWSEEKWDISGNIAISIVGGQVIPILELGGSIKLFEK